MSTKFLNKKKDLTARQHQALEFIYWKGSIAGYYPTLSQIGEYLSCTRQNANQLCNALQKKSYIAKDGSGKIVNARK